MFRKTAILLLFAAGLGLLFASAVRLALRALTADGPVGFGLIFEDCPRCGHRVVLSPGKTARCESCGERLAACERCGKVLAGPEVAEHDSGTAWLCEAHRDEADWETARFREFESKDALTPPTETPLALEARREYERRVRDAFSSMKDPFETMFPPGERCRPDPTREDGGGFPKGVTEAYRFYERAVMSRDNGTVGVFRWELEGSPLFLVRCDTDGSDGFLEIVDGDGTPLGYARTDLGCPAWTSKGVVRRRAFSGDRDETDRRVADAVKRLRGDRP